RPSPPSSLLRIDRHRRTRTFLFLSGRSRTKAHPQSILCQAGRVCETRHKGLSHSSDPAAAATPSPPPASPPGSRTTGFRLAAGRLERSSPPRRHLPFRQRLAPFAGRLDKDLEKEERVVERRLAGEAHAVRELPAGLAEALKADQGLNDLLRLEVRHGEA